MRDNGTFEVDVRFTLDNRQDLDIILMSQTCKRQPISGSPLKIREKTQTDLVPEFGRFRC
jgi:hypothetical protein